MIKSLAFVVLSFFSFQASAEGLVACPAASSTSSPQFCATFAAAGSCYCATKLPKAFCTDMKKIYSRMITVFGSIEAACKFQKETPTQECIDGWTCYKKGGKDSQGNACSGTGNACE